MKKIKNTPRILLFLLNSFFHFSSAVVYLWFKLQIKRLYTDSNAKMTIIKYSDK